MKVSAKKVLVISYLTGVHVFALVGVLFVGVFLAVKFKITDVSGTVDDMSSAFEENALNNQVLGVQITDATVVDVENINSQIDELNKIKDQKINQLCNLDELSYIAPKNVAKILEVLQKTNSDFIAKQMLFAVETHLEDREEFDRSVIECTKNFTADKINEEIILARVNSISGNNIFGWPDKTEWGIVVESVIKDKAKIEKAAQIAKIEPRYIVSSLVVEQLRLFYSQRELYKKYFEPLKILANSYQISLGVMSIKEATAQDIERHLQDSNSVYYLGSEYEHLLDYPDGVDVGKERFNRLSNNDHYWNYLYGALYLKQLMTQWEKAGYDLKTRPEIVGTLFNVGFPQSKPNVNPKVGGSTVSIDGTNYSFGRLSYEFFYSGEMFDEFPYTNIK